MEDALQLGEVVSTMQTIGVSRLGSTGTIATLAMGAVIGGLASLVIVFPRNGH